MFDVKLLVEQVGGVVEQLIAAGYRNIKTEKCSPYTKITADEPEVVEKPKSVPAFVPDKFLDTAPDTRSSRPPELVKADQDSDGR